MENIIWFESSTTVLVYRDLSLTLPSVKLADSVILIIQGNKRINVYKHINSILNRIPSIYKIVCS